MNKALFNRRVRQLHLWFGLAIGVQIGLWLISGLFMTWFSIESVRGNHLKTPVISEVLTDLPKTLSIDDIRATIGFEPQSMLLKVLNGQSVWVVKADEKRVLLDAESGAVLSPIKESLAKTIASAHYTGTGTLSSVTYLIDPPREYGRNSPVWRVNFSGTDSASFYVDPVTGEVKAVRTRLWRIFDFMWGLHIMDWKNRENFNSWWIKMTALLAVIFFISGLLLSIFRVKTMVSMMKKKREVIHKI